MNKKFSIQQSMISGIADQENRLYKKIEGKNGVWYIAIQENEADNIYYISKTSANNSQGFAGAELKFTLENGEVDIVKGPWHSNSDSLYIDTNYDIRNKHYIMGICALGISYDDHYNNEYLDVLHYDEVPIVGEFLRIEFLAQELANKYNKRVYYAYISKGGGSSHFKEPECLK